MPAQTAIDEILAQRHLAFVGVSRDPRQFSAAIYRALRDGGRTMYPVNDLIHDGEHIGGDVAYAALADVPDPVDGVVIMVPFDRADEVTRQALERGISRVWLHRGVGRGSASPTAVARAQRAGAVVVDGACPMMFLPGAGAGAGAGAGGVHRLHRRLLRRRISA